MGDLLEDAPLLEHVKMDAVLAFALPVKRRLLLRSGHISLEIKLNWQNSLSRHLQVSTVGTDNKHALSRGH